MNNELNPQIVAVMVILSIDEGVLKVALYKREREPFLNQYSLPAGLLLPNESLDTAAKRVLKEKTGVENVYLEQMHTFSEPDRDPITRTVGVAYFALVPSSEVSLTKERANWVEVKNLELKAFDHKKIVEMAVSELKNRILYTNIIHSLLPQKFTLTQLQNIYESILEKKFDKRNFRKKIVSLNIIKKTEGKTAGSRQRPAQLFEFIIKKTL